jgi:quinol monooxygenase YgiN
MTMIHVIATIEIAAGRRDDFLAAFNEIVPEVRAEKG